MRRWHRRIGLAVCALLLLISVTGSMLLLKREYLWLTVPEAREQIDAELLPFALEKLDKTFELGEWAFVSVNIKDLALHKVFMEDGSYLLLSQHGEVLDRWRGNDRFEDWLLDLHHRLLLGNTVGLNAVGLTGFLVLLLVCLGLRLWWPRRKFFRYGILPRHGLHGDTQRSHANLGAIVALPAILIAVTGVILVYPSESRWAFQNGFSNTPPKIHTEAVQLNRETLWSWYDQIAMINSHYDVVEIAWVKPASFNSIYRAIGFQESKALNNVAKSSVRFYSRGKIVYKPAHNQALSTRGLDLSYPLHIGSFNTVYRYAMFVFGLGLTALSFLGLLSYWRRKS